MLEMVSPERSKVTIGCPHFSEAAIEIVGATLGEEPEKLAAAIGLKAPLALAAGLEKRGTNVSFMQREG